VLNPLRQGAYRALCRVSGPAFRNTLVRVNRWVREVDAMTLTAPATAIGSTLVMVDRDQAGDWQQALAGLGRRLPVGWDAAGERSGIAP
jgi:hypothetical protein